MNTPKKRVRPSAMHTLLLGTQSVFILSTFAAVVLGSSVWVADLVSFFWVGIVAAAAVLLLTSLVVRRLVPMVLGVLGLAIALVPVLRLPAAPDTTDQANLRIITANLFVENTDPTDFLALLAKEKPDVLVTQETTQLFQNAIAGTGIFPFESSKDLRSRNDMKIFSRYPILSESQVRPLDQTTTMRRWPLRLVLDTPGKPLVLYAVHPDTPRTSWQWQRRALYLDTLARSVEYEPAHSHVIVAGDWNTPPWSSFFRDFFNATGYRLAQSRWWLTGTRISLRLGGISWLGIPIDHLALSPNIGLADWRAGPKFGSNHLPVVADVRLEE